jgi:hypothetical protein
MRAQRTVWPRIWSSLLQHKLSPLSESRAPRHVQRRCLRCHTMCLSTIEHDVASWFPPSWLYPRRSSLPQLIARNSKHAHTAYPTGGACPHSSPHLCDRMTAPAIAPYKEEPMNASSWHVAELLGTSLAAPFFLESFQQWPHRLARLQVSASSTCRRPPLMSQSSQSTLCWAELRGRRWLPYPCIIWPVPVFIILCI